MYPKVLYTGLITDHKGFVVCCRIIDKEEKICFFSLTSKVIIISSNIKLDNDEDYYFIIEDKKEKTLNIVEDYFIST